MTTTDRIGLLRRSAAESSLAALRGRPLARAAEPETIAAPCPACAAACRVRLARQGGEVVLVRLDAADPREPLACAEGLRLRALVDERAPAIAGVLLVTAPGAAPRVAAQLLATPGLELTGGDGDSRLAAVLEAEDGAALDAAVARLRREHPELLAVHAASIARTDVAR
jgi:hypothetical protein